MLDCLYEGVAVERVASANLVAVSVDGPRRGDSSDILALLIDKQDRSIGLHLSPMAFGNSLLKPILG